MEEIMNALRNIQKEMDEQKTTIRKSAEDVTDKVTHNVNKILSEKFAIWEEKYENLNEKVEKQEKRLHLLEKQARQRNIVFFGIEEKELSYINLESNVISFIEEFLNIKLDYRDIQETKRIGRKGDRPRPIIVTFSTLGLKINIFKQKSALNDTQYYVKEDYPQHVLEKRKELQEQVRMEREKGNIAIIKYDKLIIVNKKMDTTNNNKRTLPHSPENMAQQQEDENIQANKKNKILHSHPAARRSSSISEGMPKPGIQSFLVNQNTIKTTNKQKNNSKSN